MNDSSYYQKKRKNEFKKHKSKKTISDTDFEIITFVTTFLLITVFLFVMLWKSLEDGKVDCESQGGEWHSTYAGKVVITSCEGVDAQ